MQIKKALLLTSACFWMVLMQTPVLAQTAPVGKDRELKLLKVDSAKSEKEFHEALRKVLVPGGPGRIRYQELSFEAPAGWMAYVQKSQEIEIPLLYVGLDPFSTKKSEPDCSLSFWVGARTDRQTFKSFQEMQKSFEKSGSKNRKFSKLEVLGREWLLTESLSSQDTSLGILTFRALAPKGHYAAVATYDARKPEQKKRLLEVFRSFQGKL